MSEWKADFNNGFDRAQCPCGQACNFDFYNGACEPTCPCGGWSELLDGPRKPSLTTERAVALLDQLRHYDLADGEKVELDAEAVRAVVLLPCGKSPPGRLVGGLHGPTNGSAPRDRKRTRCSSP